jgi:hypothetical protein
VHKKIQLFFMSNRLCGWRIWKRCQWYWFFSSNMHVRCAVCSKKVWYWCF